MPICSGGRAAYPVGAPTTGTVIMDRRVATNPDPAARRPYDVFLPPGYRCDVPAAVVVALHGGGGNKQQFVEMACPNGDVQSPLCFSPTAAARNMVVVYANGSGASLAAPELRTWNAGGGTGGWTCVSGSACQNNVDDVTFLRRLLVDLNAVVNVDPHRVYATGMSNGGALAHRLACEMADVFAAVAPVGSGNQFAAAATCSPARPVAVLQVHGTADPCWPWMGGEGACVEPGNKASVVDSLEGSAAQPGWARRNGCQLPPTSTELADTAPGDGTTVTRLTWNGCAQGGDVEVLRINAGGHRWPQGYARPPTSGIDTGTASQDIHANSEILDFLGRHSCATCAF
jgi:polyhydroxybutyrate depolymerase